MSDQGIDVKRMMVAWCFTLLTAAACGGDTTATTTTMPPDTTLEPTTTLASTTTAAPADGTRPPGPTFLEEGDGGPFVAALQHLLNCVGHGPISTDGVFGAETAAAVRTAQEVEGTEPTGAPDEATFAALSRACREDRGVAFAAGTISADLAGNAAPDDPDRFSLWVIEGQTISIDVWSGAAVSVAIETSDGLALHAPTQSGSVEVTVPTSQMYLITVTAGSPISYAMTVEISPIDAPGADLDQTLETLFSDLNDGDLDAAMAPMASGVIYHDLSGVTYDTDGAAQLEQAFALLSQGPSLASLGVSGRDGEIVTFGAAPMQEDGERLLFAARVIGGVIVEWWDQPATVESVLDQVFTRLQAGDVAGAMSLFDMSEVTFHRLDGTTVRGAEGRSLLRQSFIESPPLVFVEMTSYEGALADFTVSEIAADPDLRFYTARFDGPIVEWWELPEP